MEFDKLHINNPHPPSSELECKKKERKTNYAQWVRTLIKLEDSAENKQCPETCPYKSVTITVNKTQTKAENLKENPRINPCKLSKFLYHEKLEMTDWQD